MELDRFTRKTAKKTTHGGKNSQNAAAELGMPNRGRKHPSIHQSMPISQHFDIYRYIIYPKDFLEIIYLSVYIKCIDQCLLEAALSLVTF